MKARLTPSLLIIVITLASAPAHADAWTGLLIETSIRLIGGAANAAFSAVKEAVIPKELPEDRRERENAEIEKAAGQVLAQYPDEQRQQMRAEVIDRLTRVAEQVEAIEARQDAISAEHGSLGSVVLDAASGALTTAIRSRTASDAAARAAAIRARF